VIDRCLFVEMIGPKSFTGEDMAELHVHGSRAVLAAVINRTIALGCRLAEPGEFTLRAFLNGRLTLAEAEGIADLIASTTELQRVATARHVNGEFAARVTALLERLEGVLTYARAACDFPDDVELEALTDEQLATIKTVRTDLSRLTNNAQTQLLKPARVVLCGAPNVGKSSLLNALLGRQRVLVDAAPGTTRDPVEVELREGGLQLIVVDTAGIRGDATGLEASGIALTMEQLETCDHAVWLVDPIAPTWPPRGFAVDLVVGSKADLIDDGGRRALEQHAGEEGWRLHGWVSCRWPREDVVAKIEAWLGENLEGEEIVVVRERHVGLLTDALRGLDAVMAGAVNGLPLDALCLELEAAAHALGQILGRDVDLDVLDKIFATFCLGK
jgi:tRNA modification GTPase